MDSKLYLYGASGHCKVVMDILQENGEHITAIIDDDPFKEELLGIAVFHSSKLIFGNDDTVIITIGDNGVRKNIASQLKCNFRSAVHPKALISRYSKVNQGSIVMAGVIINARAVIGKHCIINTAAVIEHDCEIGDYVHISPNATLSGSVVVEEGAHIGAGSVIIQGVIIGKWATVGAGAVIINDVPDYAVVVGNPGRVIKNKK